jgi:hypothetical protein
MGLSRTISLHWVEPWFYTYVCMGLHWVEPRAYTCVYLVCKYIGLQFKPIPPLDGWAVAWPAPSRWFIEVHLWAPLPPFLTQYLGDKEPQDLYIQQISRKC